MAVTERELREMRERAEAAGGRLDDEDLTMLFAEVDRAKVREEELNLAVTRLLNALSNAIDHMEANGLRAEGFKKVLREESR